MRLADPYFLALLPLAVAVTYLALRRERSMPRGLRFPGLEAAKVADRSWRSRLWWLPLTMLGVGATLAVVALARPQVEDHSKLIGEGADIVFVLDMSGSMNAVDMTPAEIMSYHEQGKNPPNRFETARNLIRSLIQSRQFDRVGLVIFSTHAWVRFPLTLDHQAMFDSIQSLVLDDMTRTQDGRCANGCTITGEATAIGDALGRAYKRLEGSKAKSRHIVLITDGDNNAGKTSPEDVARFIVERSKDRPIRVHTFQVGTGENVYIPARDPLTGERILTANGLQVYERPDRPFPVNPELLKKIADLTGGTYNQAGTLDEFVRQFRQLERSVLKSDVAFGYREAYSYPLFAALALVILAQLLSNWVMRTWP